MGREEKESIGQHDSKVVDFWAKTTSDGKPGIAVLHHMLNVGNIASLIAEKNESLLQALGLNREFVAVMAALHDIGKISPGFQRKCAAWLEEYDLTRIAQNGVWDTSMEGDHGKVSHAFLQGFLTAQGAQHGTSKYASTVVGAHHGKLNEPNDRGYRPRGATAESGNNTSGIYWEHERQKNAIDIWQKFQSSPDVISLNQDSPGLWWLAGLTTVADWIGSDERFFPATKDQSDHDSIQSAISALAQIDIFPKDFLHDRSFEDVFGFGANDLQQKAIATITKPGVYVIEAPMGMGKTEAALAVAYRLMSQSLATGLYFALPTQATSNRIHLRLNAFLSKVSIDAESQLIHGNSWLLIPTLSIRSAATLAGISSQDDARVSQSWFSSNKRALLAPFGVGTVDQALLGVVAAKHFFVRHFALAGKVVILDEVHSYDLYTGTLINRLIEVLEGLGCTVLILSATLTKKRRAQLLPEHSETGNTSDTDSYPLITGRAAGTVIQPVSVDPPPSREISIQFTTRRDAEERAVKLAQRGGLILWVCNTVAAAQQQFLHFQRLLDESDQPYETIALGLLHSRFPLWRRDELESEWMERLGKEGSKRRPCILVSTQIVEQSVDLDADLLVSELAPTDMLLQRAGRLWRHKRKNRPASLANLLIIQEEKNLEELRAMATSEIKETLGRKALVYSPYVLLRTLAVWNDFHERSLSIPGQIRQLLEDTYSDSSDDPDSWKELKSKLEEEKNKHAQKALMNSNIWQAALNDEEGVQTRLSEIPQVSIVLCREIGEAHVTFADGSRHVLPHEKNFTLSFAQSVHKNLVKIAKHRFERCQSPQYFSEYVKGQHVVGLIAGTKECSLVELNGLKQGIAFCYSDDLGMIDKDLLEMGHELGI